MLIFSISLPDPYFMDTPERRVWGWKEAQRQGDFTNNFSIYTYTSQNIYTGHVSVNDLHLHWIYTAGLLTLTGTTLVQTDCVRLVGDIISRNS